MKLEGAYTALVTPFAQGEVDLDALRALVERQIAGGVHGLIPCGTTGESVTLSLGEFEAVVRAVVEQARGRVPVLAGADTHATRKTIELARLARSAGVDGLMLVCPYYNKPTQRGLEAHFRAVCEAVPLPAMLYNIPGRTGVDLQVDTLARMADVPSLVAIKEATGSVIRAQQILARCGERFQVFAGDDALTLAVMAVGGRGVVSVTANLLPEAVAQTLDAMLAGRWDEARERHLRLVPVHDAMFVETNPGPVKALMAEAGLLRAELRPPLVPPEEANLARSRAALAAAGFALGDGAKAGETA